MKLGKESTCHYHFKKSCVVKADPPYQGERICIPPEVSVRLGTEPTLEINAVCLGVISSPAFRQFQYSSVLHMCISIVFVVPRCEM